MSLGNAWHLPGNAEFPANVGMRSPVFPTDLVQPITIFSGNQFQGGGNAANQLQDGSQVAYKRSTENSWKRIPLLFDRQVGNNKYFRADIPAREFAVGVQVQYYLIIAYDNRNTTYLKVLGGDPTGLLSEVVATEATAQASPFVVTMETPKDRGTWSAPVDLPNVGAHAHLLRTGKVLMWGRRDSPEQSMNVAPANPPDPTQTATTTKPATCTPFLLDPNDLKNPRRTKAPTMLDGTTNANLFCSGHSFRPDGSLLVVGGHITDGQGSRQSSMYDPGDGRDVGTWKAGPQMKNGRWYPTVTALPTGTSLVLSGSYRDERANAVVNNNDTEIRTDTEFTSVIPNPNRAFELYPRVHLASSGIVYWFSGSVSFLDLAATPKQWLSATIDGSRPLKLNDYGCSVMIQKDVVMCVGGGTPPMQNADIVNLSNPQKITWEPTKGMTFPRRQHNVTVLPDGSVLVTGGTRGDGTGATGPNVGDIRFNDLRPGQPVHIAELWDPKTKEWKMMASEQTDRCYHSTAVLLPDGRVLSSGGGEFQLGAAANDPQDSHRDAQIFSPPYLFQDGPRPEIKSTSKDVVQLATTFDVSMAAPDQIAKVSLIGLSSVTHSINTGQRLNFLDFTQDKATLKVTAPPDAKSCPPGWYMLFVVNNKGVPSVAKFLNVVRSPTAIQRHQVFTANLVAEENKPPTILEMREAVRAAGDGTRVEIGITSTCPYGLSACWGGAFEALSNLDGVDHVDPIPHTSGSTASVFLRGNGLPDLDLWTKQFKDFVRDTYALRGFEAALVGTVEQRDGGLVLAADGARPEVRLGPLGPEGKIQWDKDAQRAQAVTEAEATAYDKLAQSVSAGSAGPVTITGPVAQTDVGYKLQVRLVNM